MENMENPKKLAVATIAGLTEVAGMAGVGRFVVGLLDDIRIVDSPELTDYIRKYLAANAPQI